jgi:anti-sigma B factor antagonist
VHTDWRRVSSLALLRITIEPLEEACLIRAAGSLDAETLERLRSPLDAARSDGRTTLLDLSGVTSIDSAGLAVLLDAARAADDNEWPWFLVRPSLAVLRLVERTGTAALLPLVVPGWRGDAALDPAAAG